MIEFPKLEWRRSSRCANGSCVEVAESEGQYFVRDSKAPDLPSLRFTAAEWAAFIDAVKQGEFD
ncbi:DUF397 domain-containing protein [Couchioplanes caeruleus]|uniref:DUF397 domain-containing protein n=1 Tax=Couchioplanes caeruleus TaxID=56438 RepID=UPI0020C08501|nr:DUF397 domain-containing protein [Couchioplanes caeruleus]UQU64594.1 DUF397 domain-containing protein [Couchioplanes caeruleus]